MNIAPEMRVCRTCGEALPIIRFSFQDGKARRWVCKSCRHERDFPSNNRSRPFVGSRKTTSDLRKINICQLIRAAKSKPCADCGLIYPHYILDFDHRDPSQKRFNIAQAKRMCAATVLAEIEKCDVVCSNCHRERTHGHRFNDCQPYICGGVS